MDMFARECENLDQNAVMEAKWVSRHLDIGILFNTTQNVDRWIRSRRETNDIFPWILRVI